MAASVWYRRVIVACAAFVVLSVAAMLVYPGGRIGDAGSEGYAFFTNFFSDLGQTSTHSGASNVPALVLFCLSLVAVAAGVSIFFVTFARMFTGEPAPSSLLARIAAATGCAAAVCFLGVAATPWNLYLAAHNAVTGWAFQFFLVTVLLDLTAVLVSRRVSKRFAVVFAVFAVVLAGYVALMMFGPRLTTPEGAMVQAVGQKIIVYAAVLTIFFQAFLARGVIRGM